MTAERLTQQKTDMNFCIKADYLARQATYLQNHGNKLKCTADKEISHIKILSLWLLTGNNEKQSYYEVLFSMHPPSPPAY